MNIIIIWKDPNWILKSHFIATSKSCEWLCIYLNELHTRTHIVKGRDLQLGGKVAGDMEQSILVWTRQGPQDENTLLLPKA